MARLINDITDLKKHIVVSATFDFAKVLPHAKRAERKIIVNLIGQDQYDALVIHALNETANTPVDQVKYLLQEAVAHYALFIAMPTINLLITNSGTKQSEGTNSTNADWKEKRDLNRYLVKTFNEALDDAFQIMEDNVDDFDDWSTSDFYTVFKNLIVSQTKMFNEYFDIQKNRPTFCALKPYMREAEDQYLRPMVGDCTLEVLKTKSTDDIILRGQELAQKAIVALTVAKACTTGMFQFTETAMTISSELLPWDRMENLKDDALCRLEKARQVAGENYLKTLKKLLVDNPEVFDCYVDKTENGITNKLITKKSGLWL